jgi:hypothetical protein
MFPNKCFPDVKIRVEDIRHVVGIVNMRHCPVHN